MRFSIWPNAAQPWPEVLATAQHADATGWHGVYLADHFMGDGGGFGPVESPTLEATAMLAGLATATERVRLASLVLAMTYRHPAVVANWASTVDHLSNGRLTLGVGAGWQVNEHEQYGIGLPPVGELVTRFDEGCAVITGLLRDERTTFDGRHYKVTDALCEPKPVQARLPLLVGGKGDRMLRITARHADAWNMWSLPPTIIERRAALDRACEAIDRDPATIETSTQALIRLTDDPASATRFVERVAPRAAVGGTIDQVADVVAGWQAAGVTEVIVPDTALGRGPAIREAMDQLIEGLTPLFGD